MRENASLVRNTIFIEVSHSSHMAPLESPEEFNGALSSFLDELK